MSQIQPPTQQWAGAQHQIPQTRSSPIGAMIAGAAIFAAGCGSGVVVGWVGAVANTFSSALDAGMFTPFDAMASVDVPGTVVAGEEFEIVVSITDTASVTRMLETIDFYGGLDTGMTVVSSDPPIDSESQEDDWLEYIYGTSFAADSTLTVTMTVVAKNPGTWNGTIDIYLDDYASDEIPVFVVVE